MDKYQYDDKDRLPNIAYGICGASSRPVKEGEKTYEYGWLDKVMRVAEDGKELARFEYHNNNQLAKVVRENGIETFEWDGLALIERNGTKYINEPHAGGGNPILATTSAPNANSLTSPSQSQTIFTDMLGTSLGTVKNNAYSEIEKTAFGNLFSESAQLAKSLSSANTFFTGKPYVEDLGYIFLLRNYRADMGKWLSQDLIGYPDGWNDLAYCNNHILECVDYNGLWTVQIGVTLSGGSLLGGSISFGIAIGHSTESGYTAGFYSSVSGGMDAGYSIGASITGTHTGYGSIDALSGTAVSVGGSLGLKLGAGFNIGGEANIPSEAKTFDPFGYSINVGYSMGVPVEIYSMITETVIHKLIDTGGTVTSIKE